MAGGGFEDEASAEEFGALVHAEESEVSVGLGFGDAFGGEGAAVVADFEDDAVVVPVVLQFDPSALGAGVFLDVLQSFLGEPEKVGEAVVVEEAGGLGLDVEVEGHAGAFAEGVGMFFEGGGEAEVIEEGGAEGAGEVADVVEGGLEIVAEVDKFLAEPRGDAFFFGEADAGGGGGEDLGDVVVQFAAEVLVFLLAGFDEGLGEVLQVADVGLGFGGEMARPAAFEGEGTGWCVRGSGVGVAVVVRLAGHIAPGVVQFPANGQRADVEEAWLAVEVVRVGEITQFERLVGFDRVAIEGEQTRVIALGKKIEEMTAQQFLAGETVVGPGCLVAIGKNEIADASVGVADRAEDDARIEIGIKEGSHLLAGGGGCRVFVGRLVVRRRCVDDTSCGFTFSLAALGLSAVALTVTARCFFQGEGIVRLRIYKL